VEIKEKEEEEKKVRKERGSGRLLEWG